MAITAILLALPLIIFSVWYKWNHSRISKQLKDIPGPFIIPFFGSVFFLKFTRNTNFISRIHSLHQTYGPHVKLFIGNSPIISISDATDNKTYLNHPKSVHKPKILYHDFKLALGNGLPTANGDIWHSHHKILSKTFNAVRVNSSIDDSQKEVEELVISLSPSPATYIDLELEIYKCLLILNTNFFFGHGIEDPERWPEVTEIITRVGELIGLKIFNPLFKIDSIFNSTPLGKEFRTLLLQGHKFAEEIIERSRSNMRNGHYGSYINTVVHLLLNAECNKQDIQDEVLTFAAASTDSSTRTIGAALVLLALHPATQDKLFIEILDVLGPTGLIDKENIKHLKYLEMVVLETQRLFPAVPFFGRQNPCDVQLSNFTIPANTTIMTNVFSMHRNEKYWPDPLAFKPERFAPENSANIKWNAFMPFAVGPRMCPGGKYSTLQTMVVLANVIRKYKVSTNYYKSVAEFQLSFGISARLVGASKCTLEERKLI